MSIKCECGFLYVPGRPEDEIRHEKQHSEYLHGPEIETVRELSSIATIGSYSIYIVDQYCPENTRIELAHVAFVAKRSMPDYPSGYDGTVNEDDQRLYIAADGVRIVGMAIAVLENYFWQCSWNPDGSLKLWRQPPKKFRNYKVARVWTAPSKQKKGLAFHLIPIVSKHLQCDIVDLGWELPLSKPGEKLVRRFCPNLFWGCGDALSINKYFQEN